MPMDLLADDNRADYGQRYPLYADEERYMKAQEDDPDAEWHRLLELGGRNCLFSHAQQKLQMTEEE